MFLEIFFQKVCEYVCLYVCLYICLSFCDHVSKPLTGKSSPYTRNKCWKKPVLHLPTGKLLLESGFLSGLKTVWSNFPQALNQAFLAVFTAVLQLKSTQVFFPKLACQAHRKCISCQLKSGHDPCLHKWKWRAAQRLEFSKNNTIKQLRRYFCT